MFPESKSPKNLYKLMNQNNPPPQPNEFCVSEGHPDFVGGQSYRNAIDGSHQETNQSQSHLEIEVETENFILGGQSYADVIDGKAKISNPESDNSK